MDNIGVFDRSHGIPGDAHLEQVDGTSWMALYCLNMLEISIEIALIDIAYEEMATKYFGDEDPLGSELMIRFRNGNEEMLEVGAVAEVFPIGAGFSFDFLVGYEKRLDVDLDNLDDWNALTATFFGLQ